MAKRAIWDKREGMRRIDRDRRQHREQPIDEKLPQPSAVGRRSAHHGRGWRCLLRRAASGDRPSSAAADAPDRSLTSAIAASCWSGAQSVIALHRDTAGRQFLQAGDPDHVEFVEVAVGDRQKPHPFEQRVSRIPRLFEHALVEREPGQLAIDVALPARIVGPERPPLFFPMVADPSPILPFAAAPFSG